MADPLSTAANAAAIVGLADVACRLGKELYEFFRAVKDAPRDIQNMLQELRSLEGTLLEVRKLAVDYADSSFSNDGLSSVLLEQTLQGCVAESKSLLALVEKVATPATSAIDRFKWVLDHKKVKQSLGRLQRLRTHLNMALSLSGRRNEITIRNQISLARDDIRNLAVANQASHADSVDLVCQAITQSAGSTSTSIESLQRENRTSASAISAQLRSFQHDVKQDASDHSSLIQSFQREVRNDARMRLRRDRIQFNRTMRMNSDVRQMKSMLARFATINIRGEDRQTQAINGVNVETLTIPLMLMKSKFYALITPLFGNGSEHGYKEDAQFLLQEFNALLAASHEVSARSLRDKQRKPHNSPIRGCNSSETGIDSQHLGGQNSAGQVTAAARLPLVRRQRFCGCSCTPGKLIVSIEKRQASEGSGGAIVRAGFEFTPQYALSRKGLSVIFEKAIQASMYPTISRRIRTFNVIPGDHPIYRAVFNDDLGAFRYFLADGIVKPWDRTEPGDSLIQTAAMYGSANVLEAMLQDLSIPIESDADLSWRIWAYFLDYKLGGTYGDKVAPSNVDHWIRISEYFHRYKSTTELEDSGSIYDSVFFLGMDFREVDREMWKVCQHFLHLGYDINYRNSKMETPLMVAASSTWPSSAAWLQILIENGANVFLLDRKGRSPLHKTMQHEGCAYFESTYTSRGKYYYPGAKKDYCFLVEEKLISLLKAGCSPRIVDNFGRSPGSYARYTYLYSAWVRALEATGNVDALDDEIEETGSDFDSDSSDEYYALSESSCSECEDERSLLYEENDLSPRPLCICDITSTINEEREAATPGENHEPSMISEVCEVCTCHHESPGQREGDVPATEATELSCGAEDGESSNCMETGCNNTAAAATNDSNNAEDDCGNSNHPHRNAADIINTGQHHLWL